MPTGYVPAKKFLTYKSITLFEVYIDDIVANGVNPFEYSLDDESKNVFDIHDLVTFTAPDTKETLDPEQAFHEILKLAKKSLKESIDSEELTADGIQHLTCLGGDKHGESIPIPKDGDWGDYTILRNSDNSKILAVHKSDFEKVINSLVRGWEPPTKPPTRVCVWSSSPVRVLHANVQDAAVEEAKELQIDPGLVQTLEIPS